MGTPSGNTGDCKNRCIKLLRDPQHRIYKSTVEIHIGTDRFEQMTFSGDCFACQTLYSLIQLIFFLQSFFLRKPLCIGFQNHFTRVGQCIDCMAHTIDETGFVKYFFIQHTFQIFGQCFFILIIRTAFLNISKHLLYLQVGTTMAGTFQRCNGSCRSRIGICSRRSDYMIGKCRVVTTTMLRMQHQCHIQYLRFQLGKLPIRAKHLQYIFRNGHIFIRQTDHQRVVSMKMSPCAVRMNCDLRHLCDQLQGLTQYIGNCYLIRVGIITI